MSLTEQAQAFLDVLAEQKPPRWEDLPTEDARSLFASLGDLFGTGPPVARIVDHVLPGNLKVRVYSNRREPLDGQGAQAAVMYMHGGGWVLGDLDTHDALCRRLAVESDCAIIAIDYALSPEARFPVALHQCYDATVHVANHADAFGVDPGRIAVAGDSAGGNLAAAVAMKARDQGGPPIRLQVLVYPVIEPSFDTSSYQAFAEQHGLTRASMQWFWQQYLGQQAPTPHAAPSLAASHEGLPPAHIVTAEYDVLRDEGEAYARQLSAAGVPVTHRRYDGNLHGFIHFAGAFDDGLTAAKDIAEILRSSLSRTR